MTPSTRSSICPPIIATKYFAPHRKKGDQIKPTVGPDGTVVLIDEIKEALDAFSRAGLLAGSFDDAVGGMQLPAVVAEASMLFFRAANPSTTAYLFLTLGNANLLVEYGTSEYIDTWVRPMLEGRYLGTMCLSEPDAGSSLADITTKAAPAEDGTYRITGTKMWVTGGDHELAENIVHLVLAKVPGGGPGVKGISLFVVPKYLTDGTRNDVALVALNHKMGNHATTNALLNFGDGTHRPAADSGAIGYLVGEEHKGLAYMFHMMNEARVAVGLQATAIGYAGYSASVKYAKERTQGRTVDGKDPVRPAVPIIEHADVKRMLLAQKSYVEGALALGLYCTRLVDEQRTAGDTERRRAQLLLEVLTPIAKSWPSQWCLEANNLAIQVHGGYGYSTEFDVEQGYRDNRLNAIHEGTHGIARPGPVGPQGRDAGRRRSHAVGRADHRHRRQAHPATHAHYAAALREAVQRLVGRHRRALGRRRCRGDACQFDPVPGSHRAHRDGMDLVGADDCRRRQRG